MYTHILLWLQTQTDNNKNNCYDEIILYEKTCPINSTPDLTGVENSLMK